MKSLKLLPLFLVTSLITGCQSESARVSRIAEQAMHQQSRQNEEMARLNREATVATERLVEADAESRREFLAAQQSLTLQRDALEEERREIAAHCVRESLLAPILWQLGTLALCLIPVAVALLVLQRRPTDENGSLNDILIEELATDRPRLLASSPASLPGSEDVPPLPADSE
ncbi:MAG: hypothetical protein HUJ26_15915 [Planctomycetaceae bacterium]|nr:hypothetical protein [Planctomycetaceae bacterium]